MAKRNNRVRSSVVGDPEEINEILDQEFNPVKTQTEQPQPEIKTYSERSEDSELVKTAAFDNSRLEFLRMTIGPVQNFYQTLGNILFSLSTRVDSLHEEVIKQRVKQDLYEDYLKHTVEQKETMQAKQIKSENSPMYFLPAKIICSCGQKTMIEELVTESVQQLRFMCTNPMCSENMKEKRVGIPSFNDYEVLDS